MGLGKTLQALALICHARERDPGVGPFLVVAPTSVVSELGRRGGALRPRAEGRRGHRHARRSPGARSSELAAADVVVTTYTLFRLDADAYQHGGLGGR